MRSDMVRAYVETLLEQLSGNDKVKPDADGDYPVRYRKALYFVRLIGDKDPVVQVFAIAVDGVEPTPELMTLINDVNRDVRFVRVFWVRGQVLVETELIGESLDKVEFDNACRAVATVTDHWGPLLAEKFGGRTAFADEKEAPTPPEDKAMTGLYL